MNTQQSSENPRRAAMTATVRAYLVPVLVILLVITGGFSIYALNTGLRTNVESNAQPSRAAQLTTRISTQTVTRTYSGEVSVSPARSYTVGTPQGVVTRDGANAGASNGAQNSARPNSDTSAPGATARKRYPITIDLPENTTASTRFQATVTLNRGAENALAVLEAAVKTEENGTHSITLDNGQSVPVTLGVCSAGICELVNPATELKAGTVVKLKER